MSDPWPWDAVKVGRPHITCRLCKDEYDWVFLFRDMYLCKHCLADDEWLDLILLVEEANE